MAKNPLPVLAVVVEDDEYPGGYLVCGGCWNIIAGSVGYSTVYYLTPVTYDMMAGKACSRCRRMMGEVALHAAEDV